MALTGPTLGRIQVTTGCIVPKHITFTAKGGRGTHPVTMTPLRSTLRGILVTLGPEPAILTGLDHGGPKHEDPNESHVLRT